MRNSSPPDSPDSRADRAFPRSSMLRRIEREERNHALRRIGKISAWVVAGVLAVAAGPRVLEWLAGSSSASSGQSGPCPPGDLACMDERYYEEHGFLFGHGTPDGCETLSHEEQLTSPLCCPGVAVDPSTCPPLDKLPSDGGDPQDSEILPGGVNDKSEEPAPMQKPSKPEQPAIPPRRIDDPFGDSDVELPG